jgi:hypothetical protein
LEQPFGLLRPLIAHIDSFSIQKGKQMETKTLPEILKQMRADAWNASAHSEKQYVLCNVQSLYSPASKETLPIFYVNALPVCQVMRHAIDQVQAVSTLLAEAMGSKTVDIKATVKFGNTTCYLHSLEIVKTSVIATGNTTQPFCKCSPQDQ